MRVDFIYNTGIYGIIFTNPQFWGSWDDQGRWKADGISLKMFESVLPDGSQQFKVSFEFADNLIGTNYSWGVRIDGPSGGGIWGIIHEVDDAHSTARYRKFRLQNDGQLEDYFLSQTRNLGVNKTWNGMARAAVWAPNAEDVMLVFGQAGPDQQGGYIDDMGGGISGKPIQMLQKMGGIWVVDGTTADELSSFKAIDHFPYMFAIRKAGAPVGHFSYRTDLYSRCQIGKGNIDPLGKSFGGKWSDLDGTKSCSVVVDPEKVTANFSEPDWPETSWTSVDDFWANEFDEINPLPTRIEDLVIYELHLGGLGYSRLDNNGQRTPGTLEDAMEFLDYLVELGVNAIEFLPTAEYHGIQSWGYVTSHYFTIEFSGGGRDKMKHFIRACHQRGIVVILDVVYNHYTDNAERAQWSYDDDKPENNIFYWYEGNASDYPTLEGGYVDNQSTGYAPRYWDEKVRSLFISSAIALVKEFHVDGFRVDQTTSIHSYNVLHADGRSLGNVNMWGAKLLREWTNAINLVAPGKFLIAEDHSGWDAVTRPTYQGGLGFNAAWYADFYHHLAGDTDKGIDYAKLLTSAASSDQIPLAMNYFVGALQNTSSRTVIYNESHDEAGNAKFSGRTISIAVARAPLVGDTRLFAEARCRVAAGLSLLSAGVPMFFMGEEVGFQNNYTYNGFVQAKEDFFGLKSTSGKFLFRFYQNLINLRLSNETLRSGELLVRHVNNEGRTVIFERILGKSRILIAASLSNQSYASYQINNSTLGGTMWKELLNSDSLEYGGWGICNSNDVLASNVGELNLILPRCGIVVFKEMSFANQ